MKKYLLALWAISLFAIANITNANYYLNTENIWDSVKVTVTSDFSQISDTALHLWFDTSSLNVTNLNNGNVLSNVQDLTSNESWINYIASSESLTNWQWTMFSFLVSKNENADWNDFVIELTDSNVITDSWEEVSAPAVAMINLENVNDNISNNVIIAAWETNIQTWTINYLFLSLILLTITGWILFWRNKKEIV